MRPSRISDWNDFSNSHLHNTPMLPIKCKLNQVYLSWADKIWSFSRWMPWWPSWILRQNHFSHSKSPCLPPSLAHWLTILEQITNEEFQDGQSGGHFGYDKMILVILKLHVTPMPPTKFWLIPTYHLGADVVWRFSSWPPWLPSWMLEQNDLSNSESLFCSNASHQVLAPSNHHLGDVVWRISKRPLWWPSWTSE